MAKFFQRFWGRPKPKPVTVLSESQACAIANAAVDETPYAPSMGMVKLENREGRWVWIIGSATVGSGINIIIDDATGKVTGRETWGVR
jgi:hypothetical protein